VLGKVDALTGSFTGGIWFLAGMMLLSTTIILLMGFGGSAPKPLEQSRAVAA
jgi:hypothetical protein